jgi:hypothetical protein
VSAPQCPLSAPASVHGGPSTPGRSTDFMKSTRGPDFADFALKQLGFFEINPQSVNFQLGPKFEKYLQKAP